MTQMEKARKGIMTEAMIEAAQYEGIPPELLQDGIARGEIVLPCNVRPRKRIMLAVGKGLSTKVNANIGTSEDFKDEATELSKLRAAVKAGAHSIMDLSTGGDIDRIRRSILKHSPVMVGTVPVYQAMVEAVYQGQNMVDISAEDIFAAIEKHGADGVDFITVHCGVTLEVIDRLKNTGRIMDIVSRGGAFMTAWMIHHGQENPLYQDFDRLLEIARRYDITLSLGDGLRPGCIDDATDSAQVAELMVLGDLVRRARDAGVQVMVEGPGHMPMDQIQANITLAKRLCHGAPFFVLGPLVTDIAPGYDHITAAIGGAIAAASGADFLCYVTPTEHLGLPTPDDVEEGTVAALIAAHAADLVKGISRAREQDRKMAEARKDLDWDRQMALAINPDKAMRLRQDRNPDGQESCTMCGQFCAYKVISQYLGRTLTGFC